MDLEQGQFSNMIFECTSYVTSPRYKTSQVYSYLLLYINSELFEINVAAKHCDFRRAFYKLFSKSKVKKCIVYLLKNTSVTKK